jgi:hypothetical protein
VARFKLVLAQHFEKESNMNKLLSLALTIASSTALSCPSGTFQRTLNNVSYCVLKGTYVNADLRLTANYQYLIEEGVFVGGDNEQKSTLRIEAGTTLRGMPASFISVMRGSQILAEGTAQKPIVFTSLATAGRKRGEWGGLVLNGNAPINRCRAGSAVCEAISEGIKVREVKFGGNVPQDNSGVLKYVRVEFAGYPMAPDNELNGITFNGVGSATTVEHIQVHMNADDGIEFFGGTVNVKYVVLTENEDDSLDWDMGWQGRIQFLVADQGPDQVDNGIEADNLQSPMNASPRSRPLISNMTLLGAPKSGYGMLLRRGTGAEIYNTIIAGFAKGCIDIDDNETFVNASTPTGIRMSHVLLDCKKPFELENGDLFVTETFLQAQEKVQVVPAKLRGWLPLAGSPALQAGTTPEDLFFEPVEFIGAFGSENWTNGWINRDRQ